MNKTVERVAAANPQEARLADLRVMQNEKQAYK